MAVLLVVVAGSRRQRQADSQPMQASLPVPNGANAASQSPAASCSPAIGRLAPAACCCSPWCHTHFVRMVSLPASITESTTNQGLAWGVGRRAACAARAHTCFAGRRRAGRPRPSIHPAARRSTQPLPLRPPCALIMRKGGTAHLHFLASYTRVKEGGVQPLEQAHAEDGAAAAVAVLNLLSRRRTAGGAGGAAHLRCPGCTGCSAAGRAAGCRRRPWARKPSSCLRGMGRDGLLAGKGDALGGCGLWDALHSTSSATARPCQPPPRPPPPPPHTPSVPPALPEM